MKTDCENSSSILSGSIRDIFYDRDDPKTHNNLDVELMIKNNAIIVKLKGYGDHFSQDGDGYPILIELAHNVARIVVWDDINEQDPNIINLGKAKESNRILENDVD